MSAPPLSAPSVQSGGSDTAIGRERSRWPLLAAQALWPGLGMLIAGQTLAGVLTMALWPITMITTYLRIVNDGNSSATRVIAWVALLAALWLTQVYRGWALASEIDGATVLRRRIERGGIGLGGWLLARNWLVLVGLLFLINRMAIDAEVDFLEFFKSSNIQALKRISSGLIRPDFSITGVVITEYAWITLEMAMIGTIIGSAAALPISFFGARNLLGREPATAPIYLATRFILSVVRSIPTLIWGLMAISFGLGHFPGVIALSIFSFGLTAKLFSEAIEGIDWGPVEAVTAAGANPLHTLIFGVVPQVVPAFISQFLYCLEVNVHSSVVLGLIGAGGLGLIVNEYIATFHWEQASTVLLITIVMTLSIDYGSAWIRSRIL